MIIPTTYFGTLALLLLAFCCFTFWPNLYKQSQSRWRYELFALDFAIGAVVLSAFAAYTLGTLGPEISFTDRMLVAGRASSVWNVGAGAVFALANLLLFASVTLVGLAAAFSISFGTALLIMAALRLRATNLGVLGGAELLLLLCVGCAGAAVWGMRSANKWTRGSRGAVLAALSGLALGGVQAALRLTADPEFGPGPYATILMLCVGLLAATPCLNFFFMHIKVIGDPIGFRNYVQGSFARHRLGLISGAAWALGGLCFLLTFSSSEENPPSPATIFLIPILSVLASILVGLMRWKEFSNAPPRTRLLLRLSAGLLALGIAILAYNLANPV